MTTACRTSSSASQTGRTASVPVATEFVINQITAASQWRPLLAASHEKAGPRSWAEGFALANGVLAHLRGDGAADAGR